MDKLEIKGLASSFVKGRAKIATEVGAGEAKVFVGSSAKKAEFDAFFGFSDTNKTSLCSFERENLLSYLLQVKIEYAFQKINRYRDMNLKYWNEIYSFIENINLEELNFSLLKFDDGRRYYVYSNDNIFKDKFRSFVLPKITNLTFIKGEGTIRALLSVNYEYETSTKDSILNHNLWGVHIKQQNSALSEEHPHICIGWGNLGDLSEIESMEQLDSRYSEVWPDAGTRVKGQSLSQIWNFKNDMQVGDYVIFSEGPVCHIGQISSDYYYDAGIENQDPDYVNNRNVVWIKTDITKKEVLSESLQRSLSAQRSIWALNDYKSAVCDLLEGDYTKDEYDIDEEGLESSSSKAVLPTLLPRTDKRYPLNVILYGAPGTGKTYATAQYALTIAEKKNVNDLSSETRSDIMHRYNRMVETGQIVFTTFHQNYGYEDFIQGIRPDTSANEMAFKTVDGIFKVIADRAMNDSDNNYVIIIDEINRANISKVFGELITLIEDDKRWGEENAINATLPSGESFAVPNNLYIVGTMNSADKSISLIDTALRRRFEFVEYVPNLELISDNKLKNVLKTLNDGIAKELNSTDLLVGHSYFMGKTADDLCEIMNRSIIPLLYEYFFDNHKKVEAQIKKAIEGMDVEIESSSIGRIKLIKKGAE